MKNNADAMTTNGPTTAKQEVVDENGQDDGACADTIDNDVSTITTSTDYDAAGPTTASLPNDVNGGEIKKSNGGELLVCFTIAPHYC